MNGEPPAGGQAARGPASAGATFDSAQLLLALDVPIELAVEVPYALFLFAP